MRPIDFTTPTKDPSNRTGKFSRHVFPAFESEGYSLDAFDETLGELSLESCTREFECRAFQCSVEETQFHTSGLIQVEDR